jgi:Flp pilus assembly protein TadD
MLKINADLFPDSWNVYDSLAEAHMKNGDDAQAIRLYEKSLELKPDNQNGKDMLERLRSGAK